MIARYLGLWEMFFPLLFVSAISAQQPRVTVMHEVDSKEVRTDFVNHVFVSSYTIYETSDHKSGVEYVQEIRNESDFVAKKLLWSSAGLLVPPLKRGKSFTARNSYGMEWTQSPQEFDASIDLGIGSIEIEEVELPEGTIRKFVKDNAPCYLPRSEVISRRLREGYPPYRWLQEIFSDPMKIFKTFQRFTDGEIAINFSSSASYKDGAYVYSYTAITDSGTPIHFQWVSAASSQIGALDGLIGSTSAKDQYFKELRTDSGRGPVVVFDVVIANTKGETTLPKERLERLAGASRVYGRFSGGMTMREGSLGIKDLPETENSYVFLVPAIVPAERQ
jgi:hypothetical protein